MVSSVSVFRKGRRVADLDTEKVSKSRGLSEILLPNGIRVTVKDGPHSYVKKGAE